MVFPGALVLALGAASLFISLVRLIYGVFWGPAAKLDALQTAITAKIAALNAEKTRLKAEEDAINKQPPKTGTDLADDLNKKGDQ